ncbi:MAG: hypothetical protein ACYDAG_16150, partial [Chloroflexota bacterium]
KPNLDAVRKSLDGQDLKVSSADLVMVPRTTVELDEKGATAVRGWSSGWCRQDPRQRVPQRPAPA